MALILPSVPNHRMGLQYMTKPKIRPIYYAQVKDLARSILLFWVLVLGSYKHAMIYQFKLVLIQRTVCTQIKTRVQNNELASLIHHHRMTENKCNKTCKQNHKATKTICECVHAHNHELVHAHNHELVIRISIYISVPSRIWHVDSCIKLKQPLQYIT